jgi:hypothetical protein
MDGPSVLDQRCLFYTRRAVADNARSERKGQDTREQRKHLMEQAKAISQAERAAQAKECLQLRNCQEITLSKEAVRGESV